MPNTIRKEVVMFEYPILAPFDIGGITATQGTSRMIVTNNIVSGTWHHAFHFKPERCDKDTHYVLPDDDPDFIFENNIAHSNSGYGAIALNVVNDCTIVRDFIGYKNTEAAIMHGGASEMNVGRNLVSIDSRYGIAVHAGGNGDAAVYDSKAYGDNDLNQDCPDGSDCDHCIYSAGVILSQSCAGAHDDHKTKWFKLPLFKKCNSGMLGRTTYYNMEFIGYKSNRKSCNGRSSADQFAIGPWHKNADYVAYADFRAPKFTNVVENAVAHIFNPSQGWKNWEDCGT